MHLLLEDDRRTVRHIAYILAGFGLLAVTLLTVAVLAG